MPAPISNVPRQPAPAVFAWPVRVYWEDTDAGGVVYYANYLKFLERGRSEWLRSLGFEQPELLVAHGGMFVVRRVEADYLLPARFNERLVVESQVTSRGRASLVMEQRILRQEQLVLTANVTLVWVEEKSFKPARIPDQIVESLVCQDNSWK